MTVDVLDYIGKHQDGIFVLLSLGHKEEFYEANFFYKDTFVVLTIDEQLEKKLGCEIEDWEGYGKLMYDIIDKLPSYEELLNQVSEFKPEEYGLYLDNNSEPEN